MGKEFYGLEYDFCKLSRQKMTHNFWTVSAIVPRTKLHNKKWSRFQALEDCKCKGDGLVLGFFFCVFLSFYFILLLMELYAAIFLLVSTANSSPSFFDGESFFLGSYTYVFILQECFMTFMFFSGIDKSRQAQKDGCYFECIARSKYPVL